MVEAIQSIRTVGTDLVIFQGIHGAPSPRNNWNVEKLWTKRGIDFILHSQFSNISIILERLRDLKVLIGNEGMDPSKWETHD